MKLICLIGSPRGKNGNTGRLAAEVLRGARSQGAKAEVIALKGNSIRPCRACDRCHIEGHCPQRDDFEDLKAKILAADGLVLASPNYINQVSAQLKAFIDRTYSYLTPDFMTAAKKHRLPPGKKLVFIQTQGADDPALFGDIFPRYNAFFEPLGYFDQSWFLRGCALNEPNGVQGRQDLLDQALTVAREIVAASTVDTASAGRRPKIS